MISDWRSMLRNPEMATSFMPFPFAAFLIRAHAAEASGAS
jgi:hypothetical protein